MNATSTSSKPQTPKQQRDALEHRIETNWNGLLLNDYFNCDAGAIQDLFAAERKELAHPSTAAQQPKVQTPQEKARGDLEHKLEKDWNGLLWIDYMNCDAGGAMDLWAKEREQLEAVKTPEAVEK